MGAFLSGAVQNALGERLHFTAESERDEYPGEQNVVISLLLSNLLPIVCSTIPPLKSVWRFVLFRAFVFVSQLTLLLLSEFLLPCKMICLNTFFL